MIGRRVLTASPEALRQCDAERNLTAALLDAINDLVGGQVGRVGFAALTPSTSGIVHP